MQIQEPTEASEKLWHGFYSGPIRQDYTEEEALALWRKNGSNRPVTRESFAAKQIRLSKTMNESQALKKDEPS
jgi:hypothetical protein